MAKFVKINRFSCAIVLLVTLASNPAHAQKKLNVVTTLPDFAHIASAIGGEHVSTFAIVTGYQDPHFVDPKPSYILKLSRADMFVTVGLDLEAGWVPSLLKSARNGKIQKGGGGYVDASVNVPLLNVPTNVSREQGDIHVYGNPHYWTDPTNGKIIAQNIFDSLVALRPDGRAVFEANLMRFNAQLDAKIAEWREKMKPHRGKKIVAYHDHWPYLEAFMGFEIVDFLEPKPGIPPTPSQLAKIIGIIEQQNIGAIIIAPYYRKDSAELVARRTNASVITLASSVGAFEGIDTYFDVFDHDVELLTKAFTMSKPQ